MSKTKQKKAAAGLMAGFDAGHAQHAIDSKLAGDAERARAVALLDPGSIRPRGADSRPARADHVLNLAESIAAVGLVQPLAVDRDRRLVAGLHRLNACALLLAAPDARHALLEALDGAGRVEGARERLAALPAPGALPEPLRGRLVPCRVLRELDAQADPDAALAAEAAENTARRQYSAAEVAALADRLRAAGYRETGGRPRRGEKALRPALGLVLGVSPTTARRLLGKRGFEGSERRGKGGPATTFSAALPRVARALDVLAGAELPEGTRAPALRKALDAARKLDRLLPAAIAEAGALENDR